MSIKQVKTIKVIRLLLMSFYLYFIFNQSQLNNDFRFSYGVVYTSLLVCSVLLTNVLPKEHQLGNTFLKLKLKWLELMIEIVIMVGLAIILSLF